MTILARLTSFGVRMGVPNWDLMEYWVPKATIQKKIAAYVESIFPVRLDKYIGRNEYRIFIILEISPNLKTRSIYIFISNSNYVSLQDIQSTMDL